ncbi:hypothetical protein ACWC5C_25875 [Streptomyces sp. NPDC001700]
MPVEIYLTCDDGVRGGGGAMSLYPWLSGDPELRRILRSLGAVDAVDAEREESE